MNKTLLLASAAVCLFAVNANAAEINPYVGAKLRYVDMSNDVDVLSVDDNVYGGSIAIGASAKVNGGAVRAELEYNKNSDAEDTNTMNLSGEDFEGKFEVETESVMLNAYYDIDTGSKFTPYIGAGIGYAKVKASMKGEDSTYAYSAKVDDNNFAWQLGAGVGYAVNENVTVDAGYRYVDYGDFTEDEVKVDTSAHELYVGARYAF